ncbi:hypothetical protein PPSIR1_00405 [Plesiocystis pacifica SIR-1]|uniref:Uncharacterized protein n=1 Tax=Plesiocystis pacifica SIR-1 TaxID=391625 RepID=A6GGC7_9BACT|nr:sigma-70 family RNA polymerase sigma factor [Plesiocystis pacifica]EDM75101.1 hypothetical protein PPSIR1_00405 [Plesiocystis pacifica SIR-1]
MDDSMDPRKYEAQLLIRWQAGDMDAGSQLIRLLSPGLIRYFRSHLEGDTHDLVQDTLMHLVSARGKIREACSVRAYVYGTARFKLYEHLRAITKRRKFDPLTHSVLDLCPRISTELRGRQDAQLLLQALRSLPLDSQTALQLYYIEGMSYREIADAYGLAEVATMRGRMHTYREQLRRAIAALELGPSAVAKSREAVEHWAVDLSECLFESPDDDSEVDPEPTTRDSELTL